MKLRNEIEKTATMIIITYHLDYYVRLFLKRIVVFILLTRNTFKILLFLNFSLNTNN